MDTAQKISDAKIVAEDLIKDLEKVYDRANAAMIRDKQAWEIHGESPELFELQSALVKTSRTASSAHAELLQLVGLEPFTRLTPLPPLIVG